MSSQCLIAPRLNSLQTFTITRTPIRSLTHRIHTRTDTQTPGKRVQASGHVERLFEIERPCAQRIFRVNIYTHSSHTSTRAKRYKQSTRTRTHTHGVNVLVGGRRKKLARARASHTTVSTAAKALIRVSPHGRAATPLSHSSASSEQSGVVRMSENVALRSVPLRRQPTHDTLSPH